MELYGLEVSPDLISTVTDAVLETVAEWQNRPLEASYPLVFFDAMRVKIRDEGMVRNKAVYIALGVQADGTKDILGLWIENTEGAKFWLRVMNELRNRGVGDILIAVVDGLKGFPEAINAVFPETIIQTCVVHLIRHSLEFVSWKDRKPVVPALRMIYRAKDADAGKAALDAFDAGPLGGENIPPSRKPGGATGTESFPSSLSRRRCAGSSTRRMRWTSRLSLGVLVFVCAGDLVAKSGASAASFVRPPDHSCLAGLRRSRTPLPGPRGRHWPTKCS